MDILCYLCLGSGEECEFSFCSDTTPFKVSGSFSGGASGGSGGVLAGEIWRAFSLSVFPSCFVKRTFSSEEPGIPVYLLRNTVGVTFLLFMFAAGEEDEEQ